ncbi:MAG: exodeoxyribonuclease V subunit beta, partial [Deltaproteobacteria bacterium]|nr:exodeoxyribonuclease V subunit beta [Deltaproteobacteria bacterium]
LRSRIRERLRIGRDFFSGCGAEDDFSAALLAGANPWWPGREKAIERLDLALHTFDCAAISTIHGFCSRALQENAFETGSLYDTELVTDQNPLIQEIVADFWRSNFFGEEAPLLDAVLRKKWFLDDMSRFLRGKLANPDLAVMPLYDQVQVEQLSRNCHSLYDLLVTLWQQGRPELEEIFASHKGLSRAKDRYRPDLLAGLLAAMDNYLAAGNPFGLFEGMEKFSAAFLASQALKRETPPRHEFFDRCGELLDLVELRFIALKGSLYLFARERLSRLKAERNIRFYDDLLTDLYCALQGPSGSDLAARLRERYRAALIDEFQDTDPVQYRIFRQIFSEGAGPLFLIGDPKQAIYSFRGADIFAYLEARADVPEKNRFTMDRNWRSAPEMVDALNILFRQQEKRPFLFPAIGYPGVEAARDKRPLVVEGRDPSPLQVWYLRRKEEDGKVIAIGAAKERIVRLLAAEISGLLADGRSHRALLDGRGVLPEDIAVIVRSHDQAALVQEALRGQLIPSVVQSTASLFSTREAREVQRVLEAVAEPSREALVRAALATSLFGLSGNEIAAFFADDRAWEGRLATFREYHDLWRERGFMVFFRTMLARERGRERILSLSDGERRLTNILHCGELLHQAATEGPLGMDALNAWFGERVSVPPENEEFQIRLESDAKAVRIVTIHVSKGLEYPIVFCPFSWGGVFAPDDTVVCHDGYRQVVDFGSEDFERHRIAAGNEAMAENVRLLYVALTRAKYRCYLVWGRFRYAETSAPAYLLHYPDEEILDVVARMSDVMKDISDHALVERLQQVAERSGGSVLVTVDPEPVVSSVAPAVAGAAPVACSSFSGAIETDWRVASFTSFSAGHRETAELPDRDQDTAGGVDEYLSEIKQVSASPESLFAFPRGTTAGLFFHSVFEQLDFSNVRDGHLEELVENQLGRYGFDLSWREAVCTMLRNVLGAAIPVADGSVLLGELGQRDRIVEMEFFFPLSFIESRQVAKILSRWDRKGAAAELSGVAGRLSFSRVHGMVRGFMDLVFRQAGKYYLVDWKSNHLGNRPGDYCCERLAHEMERKLYHFQYLLYLVALNRYLERRDPAYRYATHFGGVLYLFLRGVDPDLPGSGVYYDFPPEGLVRELTECLVAYEGDGRC